MGDGVDDVDRIGGFLSEVWRRLRRLGLSRSGVVGLLDVLEFGWDRREGIGVSDCCGAVVGVVDGSRWIGGGVGKECRIPLW